MPLKHLDSENTQILWTNMYFLCSYFVIDLVLKSKETYSKINILLRTIKYTIIDFEIQLIYFVRFYY